MLDKLRYGKQFGYRVLFRNQDVKARGKTGVIIGEMGLPEDYEFPFYRNFMAHVFDYSLPPFIKPHVLGDHGTALIDPSQPLARESFKPQSLVDAWGSTTNKAGLPYVDCEVEWKPGNMRNPWDHGYFLYKGDGRNNEPDVCEKIGAKIVGWYYGSLLPDKKVPWRNQLRRVYEEASMRLAERFPSLAFRNAYYMLPESLNEAIEGLLAEGCETLVYQGINCPLYTDFEDYGHVLPAIHGQVRGRARIIMADQLGCQSAMREAYFAILSDRLAELPKEASVLVILSRHGHPFKKETQDERAGLYRVPLETGVRRILEDRGGRSELLWSFDEYADEFWDPKRTKLGTYSAYRRAIAEGFDYAIELPTEFPAENTDLMIFHAMKKFSVFSEYDYKAPIVYTDWEKPLIRRFREGKTEGIYAGTPVGPYRKYIVEAVVSSVSAVL